MRDVGGFARDLSTATMTVIIADYLNVLSM